MVQSSKQVISRARQKVRLINFNDNIIEGYIFIAYGQRVSDLLNDDRGFIPVESASGEMRVVSKRAIMEIEILDKPESDRTSGDGASDVVVLGGGNAYDLLGVKPDAEDGLIRAVYLDKMNSVDIELLQSMTQNNDVLQAARIIRDRYEAAYDSICHTRKIEAIAAAMKAAQPKRRRFGDD